MALHAARRAQAEGKEESCGSLLALRDVIRWLEQRPGRKNLILVSPGFLIPTDFSQDEDNLMNQAIEAQVVISTLDARGLPALRCET